MRRPASRVRGSASRSTFVVLLGQFWTGFAPVGWESMSAAARASSWFEAYLALPIVLLFYIPHKLYYRTSVMRAHNMDLHSGIRELNLAGAHRRGARREAGLAALEEDLPLVLLGVKRWNCILDMPTALCIMI